MASRDPRRCCEAVRSTVLATAWLLVFFYFYVSGYVWQTNRVTMQPSAFQRKSNIPPIMFYHHLMRTSSFVTGGCSLGVHRWDTMESGVTDLRLYSQWDNIIAVCPITILPDSHSCDKHILFCCSQKLSLSVSIFRNNRRAL